MLISTEIYRKKLNNKTFLLGRNLDTDKLGNLEGKDKYRPGNQNIKKGQTNQSKFSTKFLKENSNIDYTKAKELNSHWVIYISKS